MLLMLTKCMHHTAWGYSFRFFLVRSMRDHLRAATFLSLNCFPQRQEEPHVSTQNPPPTKLLIADTTPSAGDAIISLLDSETPKATSSQGLRAPFMKSRVYAPVLRNLHVKLLPGGAVKDLDGVHRSGSGGGALAGAEAGRLTLVRVPPPLQSRF